MKTIRLRALGLALVATVVVAAAVVATAAARPQATTLTLWNTMNDEETVTFKSVLATYEKANPDVNVNLVQVPFDQRDQKFTTAVQAGQGPDIMRAEIADVARWGSLGLLTDITSRVSAADKRDFLPAAWAYYNYAGKIWGLPQAPDALTIFYNKALFKSAGIKNTQLPATLPALQSFCQKFPKGAGIFLRADSYWVQPWVWGYGGGLVVPASKQILVGNTKSTAGMQAYKNLFSSKCAFPNKDFSNDYGNAQTAFKNGKVAMIVNGPWSTADILQGPAFKSSSNLGVLVIPKGPGGQGSPVGGNGFVISKSTKNADAAYKLMSYLTSGPAQAAWAKNNNLLPSRASSYKLDAVKSNRLITAFLPQMKVATARPVIPQGGQIYSDFGPNVQKVLNGSVTARVGMLGTAKSWKLKLFPDYTVVVK